MAGETRRTAFSFAGGGFMGLYHIGVYMCMEEHAEEYLSKITALYGASAGSLISVAAACGLRAIDGYKFIKHVHDDANSRKLLGAFHPSFGITDHIRDYLETNLPPDAHRRCRNKVGVSLTVLPSMTNWIVSDFNTRAELIQAVICSSFIPMFAGMRPLKFRGKICCDGGLSNNLPYSTDPNVITVSPFSGECDICPNGETETHFLAYITGQVMQISYKNLERGIKAIVCPSWRDMDEICARGFRDAYNFFKREGIICVPFIFISPFVEEASVLSDEDCTSEYSPRGQTSSFSSLDELLEYLEERRDSSVLFVEEVGDDADSGIFLRSTQSNQLKWRLKPKIISRITENVYNMASLAWFYIKVDMMLPHFSSLIVRERSLFQRDTLSIIRSSPWKK